MAYRWIWVSLNLACRFCLQILMGKLFLKRKHWKGELCQENRPDPILTLHKMNGDIISL